MRKYWWVLLIVVLVVLFLFTRLIFLKSGVYFYEPDEWSWDSAAKSLQTSLIPRVAGRYLFDQIPLFEFLAYLLSFIIKDSLFPRTFLDIRLVSVIASGFVTLALFRYLHTKVGKREAVFGALLFILTPLALYYSRYGGREVLLMLFSFLTMWSFENLKNSPKKIKNTLKTGLLLGLAIYAKLTALIFLAVPAFYFFITFFAEVGFTRTGFNAFELKLKFNRKWLINARANFLIGFIAAAMTLLAFLPFLIVNATFFRDRMYLVLFSHGNNSIFTKINVLETYLTKPVYWLSLTVVILILLGLFKIIKNGVGKWQDLFIFTILSFGFLINSEARPRYFSLTLPFLTVLAAVGLGYLSDSLTKVVKIKKLYLLIPTLTLITILPFSWNAIESTNHSDFNQAVKILNEKEDGRLLFSSYWPPIIQYISGIPTVRLTDKLGDAMRDSGEYPNFSPSVGVPPTQIIDSKEGAWVLIHSPVDPDEFSERKRAIDYISGNFDYFAKINDGKPNFPETNKSVTIYLFDTAVKRTKTAIQIDSVSRID